MGPMSSPGSLEEASRERTEHRRNEGNGMMEAEAGVRWPHAEECRRKLEEAKNENKFCPGASRRHEPYRHLDCSSVRLIWNFWPPEL